MVGDMGHMGRLINPRPAADNTEPVFQIEVGLPSLVRGRRVKKKIALYINATITWYLKPFLTS